MKRIKLMLIGLLSICILLAGCSQVSLQKWSADGWSKIQQNKTVVVGIDDSFVPMDFRQKDGKLVGYDVDLARAVFKRLGLKVDFQTIDWSMNVTELNNRTIDVIWNGLTITPQRKEKIIFSSPYLTNQQVLVTKANANIKKPSQMTGKVLGVQSGSSGSQDLNQYPKVLKKYIKNQSPILYDSFNNAFIDLNANRIQGLLIDSVYAKYYISHEPNPNAYRITTSGLPNEQYAVGMRKTDQKLQSKINAELKELKKDGTIAKINHKWLGKTNMAQ